MPKKKRGRQLGIQLRVTLQLAFQDRRISMRLSGMKLPMLLTPLVLLNPLGLPLLNLTKQVPGPRRRGHKTGIQIRSSSAKEKVL